MASSAEINAQRNRVFDVGREPLKMLLPICGYEDAPLVSLEKAVKPLLTILPDLKYHAHIAKRESAEKPANGLTRDESAAIILYSMEGESREKSLYYTLNSILRSENRSKLEPWFLYLKLFMSGLTRLPSARQFVYRGVKMDLSKRYKKGDVFVWWAFSSCSASLEALENEDFLGRTGRRTLFTIDCDNGKDISQHVYYQLEKEILLPAASQFEVVASLEPADGFHIIQLKEIQPKVDLLHPVSIILKSNTEPLSVTKQDTQNMVPNLMSSKVGHLKIVEQPTNTTVQQSDASKPTELLLIPTESKFKLELPRSDSILNITTKSQWTESAITIAGGYGKGNGLNQLNKPCGIYVDDDHTVFIADTDNHRIVEWQIGKKTGKIVAGGNGAGNRIDQLNQPTNVVLDNETNSLIICDCGNQRVLRWPRRHQASGEILIGNINCCGLAIDVHGFLYVSDTRKDEVKRFRIGESRGTKVAGSAGRGDNLNQLNWPTHIFVDRDQSVYVADTWNHRVMKWMKDAKEGIIVAGGRIEGNAPCQLSGPKGIFVDQSGTVYVADGGNHRVMLWYNGATQGKMIVGENIRGQQANRLADPEALSFDKYGNLYIVDWGNHRIQRFSLEK
ncbi:unnamed protein product [Rotaria magnacalcarata]|uniref:NAD(P)(+)--arginine ADP-ribosyltransferase n=1 Tax=Rotaria magnacalcarata TaxID=392030 RepID=A0A819IL94_9BILA|nr:unnamed protein product [Rotaria magnacalcarata]